MIRKFVAILGGSLALASAALFSTAGLAQAQSTPCLADALINNCQGITDSHTSNHALQVVNELNGSKLVAVSPSLNFRQDFVIAKAPTQPNTYNIKYAPNGNLSNMCITEIGALNSHPVMEACDGTSLQHWFITPASGGGNNITNALSGLALSHVLNHGVQMKQLFAGTAGGKRWNVAVPA